MNDINYTIRPAKIDDFEMVFAIKKNALGNYIEQTWGWDEEFQRSMQTDEFNTENISLIEVDGNPVGTLGLVENDGNIIISRLYIIDSHQSKGIGSKIVKEIIDKNPGKTVRLGVLKVNHRAKEFYKRLGFRVNGEENQHYKMEYTVHKCLNCGTVAEQKFCPNCGQKSSVGRINMYQIFHNFFHVFTHVDSGIIFLIKEQFIRPGKVVREYLEGKRKKYFSPFQYLLLGVAVATFFTVNLDLGIGLFGNLDVKGENAEIVIQKFIPFIYKYFNIIILITVPFMAVYSRVFFRKAGLNYAEHLTLNTFVSAQRHLMFIFAVPFIYFFRGNTEIILRIFVSVWAVFFIWTYMQFFKPKNKFWGFIKSFVACFLFLVTNGLLIVLVFLLFFRG